MNKKARNFNQATKFSVIGNYYRFSKGIFTFSFGYFKMGMSNDD